MLVGHGRPCWFIPTLFSSFTRLSQLIYFCCLHSSFCLLTFLKLLLVSLFLRSVWEWQQHGHVWSRNHGVPMWISLVSFIPSQFVLPFSHWAQLWANDFFLFSLSKMRRIDTGRRRTTGMDGLIDKSRRGKLKYCVDIHIQTFYFGWSNFATVKSCSSLLGQGVGALSSPFPALSQTTLNGFWWALVFLVGSKVLYCVPWQTDFVRLSWPRVAWMGRVDLLKPSYTASVSPWVPACPPRRDPFVQIAQFGEAVNSGKSLGCPWQIDWGHCGLGNLQRGNSFFFFCIFPPSVLVPIPSLCSEGSSWDWQFSWISRGFFSLSVVEHQLWQLQMESLRCLLSFNKKSLAFIDPTVGKTHC